MPFQTDQSYVKVANRFCRENISSQGLFLRVDKKVWKYGKFLHGLGEVVRH